MPPIEVPTQSDGHPRTISLRRRSGARQHAAASRLVGGEGVVGLVLQPVALAATDDVHADHAAVGVERIGEGIEIAAVARQAVHADDHVRIGCVAPLGDSVRHCSEWK